MRTTRMASGIIAVSAIAMIAAGCGSSGGSGTTSAAQNEKNAGETNLLPTGTSGAGVMGGTLKVVGNGDVDHLDTASAYYSVSYGLLRDITRQLVSYPTTTDVTKANTPTADMATYTVSKDGLTYTFNIKQGVMWDAPSGPRQVTSQDEVLGIKRLCNPVVSSGGIQYYTDTIVGMKTFCDAFAKAPQTVAGIKDYIDANQISGIATPNSSTVVFTLTQPASDFLNIMALPFASPAPIEDLNYLPDSPQFRQHFISDGPYKIDSYIPNKSFALSRNPAWQASTDSLRKAYVNAITITEGETDTAVQQQLQAGTADFEWDTGVPPAQVIGLFKTKDPHFVLAFNGLAYYVPFNMTSKSLQPAAVRKALQFCWNSQHQIQVSGGVTGVPATQILPPQITGYKKIAPYATPNGAGDPAKCKSMLAAAGESNLTLRMVYSEVSPGPALFQAAQSDFAKAGVKIVGVPEQTGSDFFDFLESATNLGKWDIADGSGWIPDWQGNSARSFFVPLLDGSQIGATTTNYGHYNDPTVNADIKKALAEKTLAASTADWAALDSYITNSDPAWITDEYAAAPGYFGSRVKNPIFNSFTEYLDMTNVWVN